MDIRRDTLEPNNFYHIFNRGINSQTIFFSEENQRFFLSKFVLYLTPVADLYAYCLMPNHFHLLIRIKSADELAEFFSLGVKADHSHYGLHSGQNVVSKQLAKMISSYSQAVNKVDRRHSALMESPVKRRKVTEDIIQSVIIFIHQNPMRLDRNFKTYGFSSYRPIIAPGNFHIKRPEVINIFGGLKNFIAAHQSPRFDYGFWNVKFENSNLNHK